MHLCADRDQSDVVGDLSVCLDGMTVDPEMFATAEANHRTEPQAEQSLHPQHAGLFFRFILFVDTVIVLHWSS